MDNMSVGEALQLHNQQQDPVSVQSDDSQKYEVDTEYMLERVYNKWLGKKQGDNGTWEEDKNTEPMMNKALADNLRSSIEMKINTHGMLSYYDTDFIKKVALETARVWNRKLIFEAKDYQVKAANFRIIINDIKLLIMQMMRAALHGGMRDYRGNRGKIIISRQETNQNIGGIA